MAKVAKPQFYWQSIHIVARCYNPANVYAKVATISFFQCLTYILPIESWRNTLKNYMHQYPIQNYLSDDKTLLRWTYQLHLYASIQSPNATAPPTFENIVQQYALLTKPDWGNAFWYLIHNIAINNKQPNETVITAFFASLRYLLPCPNCQKHMEENLANSQVQLYLASGRFFEWTWKFHNSVNQCTNKPLISQETALLNNK